jgi:4-aminobutyrate aminotransferase
MAEVHISPVWSRTFPLTITHGEGCYVYDTDGNRYLDFTSGIGVTNTGHCHPRVVSAAREQIGKVIHAQVNNYYHLPLIELTDALLEVVPDPSFDCFFFTNSGAEAVESAIKLARHASGKSNIITFQGGFHGRTAGTMATDTGNHIYRAGYQPLPSGVFIAPYAYPFHYGWGAEQTSQWCLAELRHMLHSQTAPFETAAMLVEPVLGEGGYVPPPKSFLQGLRQICSEFDILLILDEVQSGFGRTGKFFAVEHYDLVPDIIVMAKGLASGFPLSGITSRRELMEKWIPGSHGGTYGGNAVGCAAAKATIEVLKDGVVENARRMGEILMDELEDIQSRYPVIAEVRGLGLMIGVEFAQSDGSPGTEISKAIKDICLREGLLIMLCGTYSQVVRWIPPLVVDEEQLRTALGIFERAVAEASA